MAAGIMPKLGEPTTCAGPCKHLDCIAWRKLVGSPCKTCGAPINPGDSYYQDSPTAAAEHEECALKRATDEHNKGAEEGPEVKP